MFLTLCKQADINEAASSLPIVKRQKGGEPLLLEPNKDAQILSESSLNKLVGAADMYNLEVYFK